MSEKWKVEYNSVDITKYIATVSVSLSEGSFCYECSIGFGTHCPDLDSYDWASLSVEPVIEIFIHDGTSYNSLGKFFIETPDYTFSRNETRLSSVWGRSSHAVLANPFSYKLTGVFDEDTTTNNIIEFIINNYSKGLITFEESHNTVGNYLINANDYSFDQLYPIDLLVEFVGILGGIVVPMIDGSFRIRRPDKEEYVGTADVSLTNADIHSVGMSVSVPDFGNRVKVLGISSGSDLSFNFISGPLCWADGQLEVYDVTSGEAVPAVIKEMVGQVIDNENNPIDGIEVDWYLEDSQTTSNDYAQVEYGTTTSGLKENLFEIVQTTNYRYITLKYHPSAIKSVRYYYSATKKDYSTDITIDGNTIELAENAPYCDATMHVVYDARGIVTNEIGPLGKVGSTKIVASIDIVGNDDPTTFTEWLHFNNPCACSVSVEWIPRGSLEIAGSATEMEEVTTTYTDWEAQPVEETYTTEQQTATRTISVTPVVKEREGSDDWNASLGYTGKILSIDSCVLEDYKTVAMVGVGGNISGGQSVGYEEVRPDWYESRYPDYMSPYLWIDIHYRNEYASGGQLLMLACSVEIQFTYETSAATETTETSYEYVEVERESTTYTSAQVTAEKQPLYCAVKLNEEYIHGETINFSIIEGGEFAQIGSATNSFSANFFGIDESGSPETSSVTSSSGSSCSAMTSTNEIVEVSEVQVMSQDGWKGIFLKNEIASAGGIYTGEDDVLTAQYFKGVYLVVDGSVDYSTDYTGMIGEDKRTIFLWGGLEEGQEVAAVYSTYCAVIYLIPGDITGQSQVTVTIRASIESMMEQPIESEMSFTLVNTALKQLEEQKEALEA